MLQVAYLSIEEPEINGSPQARQPQEETGPFPLWEVLDLRSDGFRLAPLTLWTVTRVPWIAERSHTKPPRHTLQIRGGEGVKPNDDWDTSKASVNSIK